MKLSDKLPAVIRKRLPGQLPPLGPLARRLGGERAGGRHRTRFGDAAVGAFWYLLLVVVIPLASLAVLGLVALWRDGNLLLLLVGWLAFTLLGYVVFVNLPRRRARRAFDEEQARLAADGDHAPGALAGDDLPEQLAERPDWSERDSAIWQRRCAAIERTLVADPDWERFPELAADELSAVAAEYHGPRANARMRFTLPEALLVISTASERYRHVVGEHVPFADRITVASLMTLRERGDAIKRGVRWLDRGRRVARLVNPMGAVVGELRDQFTSRVLDETGASLQKDLKRLLLQEIAQVGIDLYSGRLKVSDGELARYRSRAVRDDATRRPEAAEPLRVVLVGQVSAGKSSLVNALADTLEAEVDLLPTTDRTTVHVLSAPDGAALHVVDTPGIDADPERVRQLARVAREADLVLWAVRATQPARAPDEQLYAALNTWFEDHPERRMPPVLLALTHVDRLPPRAEWAPPYDLHGDRRKGETMRRALISARAAIGLGEQTPSIPVCLAAPPGSDAPTYNVDAIAAEIMTLADEATLAQFNRRRVERGAEGGGWRARLKQTSRLGLAVGKTLLRRADNGGGNGEATTRETE